MAAKLNKMGITMVQAGRYAEALEHYSKAQYVLPQQEKGPQLFFNIGLCYARWGKHSTAQEFLKLALIKEPNYKKAEKLLEQITQIQQRASA
jgi:tetratricopeptide (TPR) repeat protein